MACTMGCSRQHPLARLRGNPGTRFKHAPASSLHTLCTRACALVSLLPRTSFAGSKRTHVPRACRTAARSPEVRRTSLLDAQHKNITWKHRELLAHPIQRLEARRHRPPGMQAHTAVLCNPWRGKALCTLTYPRRKLCPGRARALRALPDFLPGPAARAAHGLG
jgi:hypothetical protein